MISTWWLLLVPVAFIAGSMIGYRLERMVVWLEIARIEQRAKEKFGSGWDS